MQNRKKWLIDNVKSLGSALILVFLIRSTVIEAYKIPSGSMIPTLLVGDQLFVNKLSYGLRVPLSDWFGDESKYIFRVSGPSRGDIIVFKDPENADINLIKRVIGLPGDKVEMKNKVMYINDQVYARTDVEKDKVDAILESLKDSPRESLNNELSFYYQNYDHTRGMIMINGQQHFSENFGPVTVPADHYFCMGDNRDDSRDSRFWGFAPFGNIKGRAVVIWLSVWLDFDTKNYSFRPERIGKVLH